MHPDVALTLTHIGQTRIHGVTFCSLLDFFFSMLPVIAPAGENCIPASESVPKVTCFLGPSELATSSLGVLRADPDPEPGVPDFGKLLLLLLGDKTLLPILSRLVTCCSLHNLTELSGGGTSHYTCIQWGGRTRQGLVA